MALLPTIAHADAATATNEQWIKYPGNPVLGPTQGNWDADYVVSPRVLGDGTIFRMWYNGGNTITGANGIGYATSTDGVTWMKYGSPVLTPGPTGAWDSAEVELGSVIWNGTLFLMWYRGSNAISLNTGAVGLATSTNGTSWIKYSRNPILTPGQFGLEQEYLATPYSISPSPRSFDMWYSEENWTKSKISSTSRLLYATSLDGTSWNKWPDAVLSPSADPNAWDSGSIYSPSVIYDNSTFELWYSGINQSYLKPQIGFATSNDGVKWIRDPYNPILTPGTSESWDSAGVEQPNVIQYGGSYVLYYDGFGKDSGGKIGLARSPPALALPEFPISAINLALGIITSSALIFIRNRKT
jgi:hypothetical protein